MVCALRGDHHQLWLGVQEMEIGFGKRTFLNFGIRELNSNKKGGQVR